MLTLMPVSPPRPPTVCKEPPYKVEESGYAGFIMPIEVYFKNKVSATLPYLTIFLVHIYVYIKKQYDMTAYLQ